MLPLLKEIYDENNFNIIPLGFDVIRGTWEFTGINEAFRFNQYEIEFTQMFALHRDAQFCPSGDSRSLLSLVIYLNDDFEGGETKFYIRKMQYVDTKGMTVREDIKACSGIENGFLHTVITPVCGNAVVFNQNIIHESLPLQSGHQIILKTDVIVSRKIKVGFQVSLQEQDDYLKCLNFFREAQRFELDNYNHNANNLYEKCLSLRYSYPAKSMMLMKGVSQDISSNSEEISKVEVSDFEENIEIISLPDSEAVVQLENLNPFELFPCEIWEEIFLNIEDEKTSKTLVDAYPLLKTIKRKIDLNYFIPKLVDHTGVLYKFSFSNSSFVYENIEACCCVLAGYSIYLLGHNDKEKMYTINYNQEKNEVIAIPLNSFLSSLYHNEKAYGSIYKVKQQNNEKQHPEEDLSQSVDRTYMMIKHNKDFVGVDLSSEIRGTMKFEDPVVDNMSFQVENNLERLGLSKFACKYPWTETKYDKEHPYTLEYPSYSALLTTVLKKDLPGAAIVHSLIDNVKLPQSRCYCGLRYLNEMQMIADSYSTQTFNHLVFDFEKHSLQVKKINQENHKDSFLEKNHLKAVARETLSLVLDHRYIVNVSSMADAGLTFNHAGCQCGDPAFDLQEYNNLHRYPYLENIHVIFEKVERKMFAWVCYSGVAAM